MIDENLGPVDYERMPRPDLIGITAFTSQATRAYQIAARFRARGVPVVMGGIHASMCLEEALRQIKEKIILFVDDNLIGTRRDDLAHTKELFQAMIREGLTTPWVCQATINFADVAAAFELKSGPVQLRPPEVRP